MEAGKVAGVGKLAKGCHGTYVFHMVALIVMTATARVRSGADGFDA